MSSQNLKEANDPYLPMHLKDFEPHHQTDCFSETATTYNGSNKRLEEDPPACSTSSKESNDKTCQDLELPSTKTVSSPTTKSITSAVKTEQKCRLSSRNNTKISLVDQEDAPPISGNDELDKEQQSKDLLHAFNIQCKYFVFNAR